MIHKYLQNIRLFSRNVWLFFISYVILGFAYLGIFMVLFNLYLLRLGYDLEFIGLTSGVSMLAIAIFSIPAGMMAERWGLRRMMIIGMGLMALGSGLLPIAEFVPESWQAGWILASRTLVSLSSPLFIVNSIPFLMSITSPKERDYAFSFVVTLFSLSGFAGGLLAGFLPGMFSKFLGILSSQPDAFRYSMWLVTVLYGVGYLSLFATQEGQVGHQQKQAVEPKFAGLLPLGLILVIGMVSLLRSIGETGPTAFFNVYLEIELFANPILIGTLVAVCRLVSGLASLAMPFFVERWGKERIIGWGIMGLAISLLPLALIPRWGAAEIGFIGALTISSVVGTALTVYSQELVSPRWHPIMAGAIWMGIGIGGSFIAIGGGRIITEYGFRVFFLTAAALTALGGVLFLSYFRKRTPPKAD